MSAAELYRALLEIEQEVDSDRQKALIDKLIKRITEYQSNS